VKKDLQDVKTDVEKDAEPVVPVEPVVAEPTGGPSVAPTVAPIVAPTEVLDGDAGNLPIVPGTDEPAVAPVVTDPTEEVKAGPSEGPVAPINGALPNGEQACEEHGYD